MAVVDRSSIPAAQSASSASGRVRRGWIVACLALLLCCTSGCIYWRLNVFRKHLSQFSEYGYVEKQEGPAVLFRKPVLEPGDLEWLLGLAPSGSEQDGKTVRNTYAFRKQVPDGAGSGEMPGEHDLPVRTTFVDGKFAGVMFPPAVEELISNEQMSELFRQMSQGNIEAKSTSTSWSLGDALAVPRVERLRAMCGSAFQENDTEEHWVIHYRYKIGSAPNPAGTPDAEATLVFRKSDGLFTLGNIRIGYLWIEILLDSKGRGSVTLKRKA